MQRDLPWHLCDKGSNLVDELALPRNDVGLVSIKPDGIALAVNRRDGQQGLSPFCSVNIDMAHIACFDDEFTCHIAKVGDTFAAFPCPDEPLALQ